MESFIGLFFESGLIGPFLLMGFALLGASIIVLVAEVIKRFRGKR